MSGKASREEREKVRYYIGGRQYVPDESVLLCATDSNDLFAKAAGITEMLYRTTKGAFFLVRESSDNGINVELLDKEKAFEFMDRHPAGIVTENYDIVLGAPEMG